MDKTITFFGHREIFADDEVKERLIGVLNEKVSKGYNNFLIGTHGEFDKIALSSCLYIKRNINNKIKITIVLTSFSFLNKKSVVSCNLEFYKREGCKTIVYDIEEQHFKNRIIVSNKHMIDDSDLIICYVNMDRYRSGAKRAVQYAIQQGKEIINLYR
ncbi:MAG: hypothetical protein J6C53_02670 [Clostridia bacterium]|nr:hypothetical protein [Clostridia bacterium]